MDMKDSKGIMTDKVDSSATVVTYKPPDHGEHRMTSKDRMTGSPTNLSHSLTETSANQKVK